MLNELHDTIPELTITEPGNSMFYETAFPLRTPKSGGNPGNPDNCCYENTDYFTRMVIPVEGDQKRLTISVEHYTSVLIEVNNSLVFSRYNTYKTIIEVSNVR